MLVTALIKWRLRDATPQKTVNVRGRAVQPIRSETKSHMVMNAALAGTSGSARISVLARFAQCRRSAIARSRRPERVQHGQGPDALAQVSARRLARLVLFA